MSGKWSISISWLTGDFLNYGTAKLGKTICSPIYTILYGQIGAYVRVLSQYTTLSVCAATNVGTGCRLIFAKSCFTESYFTESLFAECTHGRVSKHRGLNLILPLTNIAQMNIFV